MKIRHILVLATLLAAVPALGQQVKFNPDNSYRNIRVEAGFQMLTGAEYANGVFRLGADYTQFFRPHWGFRGGAALVPEDFAGGTYLGLPVSIVYRTGTVNFSSSMASAGRMAAYQVVRDGYYGRFDRMGDDILTSLLYALFRRTEFYAGITPGFIAGGTDPVEIIPGGTVTRYEGVYLERAFSLSLDFGAVISIPVSRVSIDITPGIHYLLTRNYSDYYQEVTQNSIGDRVSTARPFMFSITGGLTYLF